MKLLFLLLLSGCAESYSIGRAYEFKANLKTGEVYEIYEVQKAIDTGD